MVRVMHCMGNRLEIMVHVQLNAIKKLIGGYQTIWRLRMVQGTIKYCYTTKEVNEISFLFVHQHGDENDVMQKTLIAH